jgi:hypothetical protein
MKILVACEFSGIVREAFKRKGHDAWSCDILDTEIPGQHIKDDVLKHLDDGWDMMIAHPPCTYLSNAGARWLFEKDGRWEQLKEAAEFFNKFKTANIPRIAIENPQPHKWATELIGHYDIKVQPWWFGDGYTKGICLWLKNLPPLMATIVSEGRIPQVHHEPPGINQAKNRSRTYPGVADAMANQWG